jgi:hypothetical protein
MSGYALLARAWGAEVAGWDRVDTPYLRHLDGVAVEISPEPPDPPAGWEAYVSTAFAGRVEGRPRAELLAELVSHRRTIVVAGAHGKTTTSAMIAFCLDRLGLDPSFLIGGDVEQLGGNARAGSGWLVVEGDESDRSVGALRPEIAVLLNVDLDHHTVFASRSSRSSRAGWPRCRTSSGPKSSSRSLLSWAFPEITIDGTRPRLSPLSSSPMSRGPTRRGQSSSFAAPGAGLRRRGRLAEWPSSTATPTIPPSSPPISPR